MTKCNMKNIAQNYHLTVHFPLAPQICQVNIFAFLSPLQQQQAKVLKVKIHNKLTMTLAHQMAERQNWVTAGALLASI